MAQIDFGRALTAPDKNPPSPSSSPAGQHPDFAAGGLAENKRANFFTVRLGRAGWANIIFAAVTSIGGLFCAFYFFNGNELWRAAAAWPGELLYRRPAAMIATIDVNQATEHEIVPDQDSSTAADHTGDPFSRTSGFLSLASPSTVRPSGAGAGLPATALRMTARSLFAQLGFPAPGGDAFKEAFDRAVADLARSANPEAAHTVVLEAADIKTERRHSTNPRHATQRQHAVKNSLQQQVPLGSAVEAASARQNTANSAGSFSSNTAQQIVKSTESTLSSASTGVGSAVSRSPISLGSRH
jgi:hypothetical protein